MKITQYVTTAGDTLRELDENVNSLIEEGFEPYGNPYYIGKTEGNVDSPICQAMVMPIATAAKIERAKVDSIIRRKRKE